MKNLTLILALFFLNISFSQDNFCCTSPDDPECCSLNDNKDCCAERPDGHGPINLMGDHMHSKGDLMFSYHYMGMFMKGALTGSEEISTETIFENYINSPEKMKMDMHILSLMFAPSDEITLMLMANYTSKSMDIFTNTLEVFNTNSSGFGDISVMGLYKIMYEPKQAAHFNVGFSIPTGSIDQRDNTPMMNNTLLGYSMQLGSGTFDVIIGGTYFNQLENFSWGAQTLYKSRIGKNSKHYTLGDRAEATIWSAFKVSKKLSLSTSINYYKLKNLEGYDSDLNSMMNPLVNSINSGRSQIDFGIGSNYIIPSTSLNKLRLSIQASYPLYQNANGIQMRNTWSGVFGLKYSFKNTL